MPNGTRETFFGHAMFLIESTIKTKIVIDPYNR